jgi:hypothetical protein
MLHKSREKGTKVESRGGAVGQVSTLSELGSPRGRKGDK